MRRDSREFLWLLMVIGCILVLTSWEEVVVMVHTKHIERQLK